MGMPDGGDWMMVADGGDWMMVADNGDWTFQYTGCAVQACQSTGS